METPSFTITKEGQELLNKVKAGKSTVINIKSVITSKDQTDVEICRKTKALTNQAQWDHSLFKEIAAICKFDGSKLASGKASFKKS